VYRAICAVDGHTPVLDTPEAITAAGLAGDPMALEVLSSSAAGSAAWPATTC
jgi:glucokinase